MAVSPVLVRRFSEAFSGSESAHGVFSPGGLNSYPETGRATSEHFEAHLAGVKGLEIYPVNAANLCRFGVISPADPLMPQAAEDLVERHGLPLVVVDYGHVGARLFLFLGSHVEAEFVAATLDMFAVVLGLDNPGLSPRMENGTPAGDRVELPYFNELAPVNAFRSVGKTMSTAAGSAYLIEHMRSREQIEETIANLPHRDGPPCLQALLISRNVLRDDINNFLINVGTYLKQLFPQKWEQKLCEVNADLPHQLAPPSLLTYIIEPLRKKEYLFRCNEPPMSRLCKRDICQLREYGIDSRHMPSEEIGALKKYTTDPPRWGLEVNDSEVILSTNRLMSYKAYIQACIETAHVWPHEMAPAAWRRVIESRLQSVEVKVVEPEEPEIKRFRRLLHEFYSLKGSHDRREEMLSGGLYITGGAFHFIAKSFAKYLKGRGFHYEKLSRVYGLLRECGGTTVSMRVDKKVRRVWRIPLTRPMLDKKSRESI